MLIGDTGSLRHSRLVAAGLPALELSRYTTLPTATMTMTMTIDNGWKLTTICPLGIVANWCIPKNKTSKKTRNCPGSQQQSQPHIHLHYIFSRYQITHVCDLHNMCIGRYHMYCVVPHPLFTSGVLLPRCTRHTPNPLSSSFLLS